MSGSKRVAAVLSALAGVLIVGCGVGVTSVDEDFSGGTCAALFKIAAAPNTPFSRIAARAALTITASDMDDLVRTLSVTDSTVEGTVKGIPAGRARLFTVAVYDSLDTVQYQGTASADLPRGSTVNVPIVLYRAGASAVINGTVVESGTAGEILFISDRSGSQQVWSIMSDGTSLRQLTTGGTSLKFHPRWSPDGSKIAYAGVTTTNLNGPGSKVYIIDRNGNPLDTVSTSQGFPGVHGISWTADGTRILFDDNTTCGEVIRYIEIAAGTEGVFFDDPASNVESGPHANPADSNLFVYTRTACSGYSSLKLYNRLTSSFTDVTPYNSVSETNGRWNRAGTRIVYGTAVSSGSQLFSLCTIGPGGADVDTVVSSFASYGYMGFCDNDTKIAFSRWEGDAASGTSVHLWVINTDGSEPVQLTSDSCIDNFGDAR